MLLVLSKPSSYDRSNNLPISPSTNNNFANNSFDNMPSTLFDYSLNAYTTANTKNNHPMITRSKAGVFKPKTFITNIVLNSSIPATIKEALHYPNWFRAMTKEYGALIRNKTWFLTPPPSGY